MLGAWGHRLSVYANHALRCASTNEPITGLAPQAGEARQRRFGLWIKLCWVWMMQAVECLLPLRRCQGDECVKSEKFAYRSSNGRRGLCDTGRAQRLADAGLFVCSGRLCAVLMYPDAEMTKRRSISKQCQTPPTSRSGGDRLSYNW